MIRDKQLEKARVKSRIEIEKIMQNFDKLMYDLGWEDSDVYKHWSKTLFWNLKDAYHDQVDLLENEILKRMRENGELK